LAIERKQISINAKAIYDMQISGTIIDLIKFYGGKHGVNAKKTHLVFRQVCFMWAN
jgi:hypothetical protein